MTVDCLLHVHSSFSYDSKTELADIAKVARANGIRCVLMSEHNNKMNADMMRAFVARCADLSDERLLIVPGLELSFDENYVHVLAFGVTEFIDSFAPACTFAKLIESVHRAGGIAVLAHPSHRRGVDRIPSQDLQLFDGVEVWNVKSGNRFLPTRADMATLESVRLQIPRSLAFAGLDWHYLHKFSRLVLHVEVPVLTRDAILHALKAGAYRIENGIVTVPSTVPLRGCKWRLFGLLSETLGGVRKILYRWQARLESRGVTAPPIITALARRFF
jgi:hypothetical protein